VFPTTLWTAIRLAGDADASALETFARSYRPPILSYVRSRGFSENEADDICQDAFVRILAGDVLAKASAARGRFRCLVLTVVVRTIQDRLRRRKSEQSLGEHDPADRDPDFDRQWVLHLSERALKRLGDQGSPYYEVLRRHLEGEPQDRRRLHNARKKLIALIRAEVAETCSSQQEFAAEVAYLSEFLRPAKNP